MLLKKEITGTYFVYSKSDPSMRTICYTRARWIKTPDENDFDGPGYRDEFDGHVSNDIITNKLIGYLDKLEQNDDIVVRKLTPQDYIDLGISRIFSETGKESKSFVYKKELKQLKKSLPTNQTAQKLIV